MTGAGQRAELTPAELDRLEDALADLDLLAPESAAEDPMPAHLRVRLGEYQSILAMTREAMPMVEVPAGILDAVIAEAQRSASERAEVAAPGLWERLRRSFVLPGFALAATAALLVVILRPGDDATGLGESQPASAARPESPVEEAPDLQDMSERPGLPAAAAAAEEGDDDVLAEREDEAMKIEVEPAAEADARPRDSASEGGAAPAVEVDKSGSKSKKEKSAPLAPKKASSASKSAAGGLGFGDADTPSPPPSVDASDKDALRTLLSAADKARNSGRCGEATGTYQQLRGVGGMEEARALVGLGLCAEHGGDASAANDYFKRARALAPAIDSVISSERQKMGTSAKKASKADAFGD